jgi:hypothetical protein
MHTSLGLRYLQRENLVQPTQISIPFETPKEYTYNKGLGIEQGWFPVSQNKRALQQQCSPSSMICRGRSEAHIGFE